MIPSFPAIASPLASHSLHLVQRAGRAFMLGGALWIAHYGFQLLMGALDGKISLDSPLAAPDGLSFMLAMLCLCSALFWLGQETGSRSIASATLGQCLATIAGLAVTLGMAKFVLTAQTPGIFGGVGVIGSCLSATCIACSMRRGSLYAPQLWRHLLLIGLLTFPLVLAFCWPAQYVPAYLTDELPFALSGFAYIAFGRALIKCAV